MKLLWITQALALLSCSSLRVQALICTSTRNIESFGSLPAARRNRHPRRRRPGTCPHFYHDSIVQSRSPEPRITRRTQCVLAVSSSDEHVPPDNGAEDRNQGILVLMTVPLAWGTFEPVVRFVYAIDPPIPGLVFSPCYYLVAASALSFLSLVTSPREEKEETEGNANDRTTQKGLSLPVLGGMELGFYLFLGNSLQVLGLNTLNSDRVAFLIQLTTIFVPLVQGIAARNLFAIPTRTWLACLIAFGGVGVIGLEGNGSVLQENMGSGLSSLAFSGNFLSQGDYLVIGAALAYTFHCIRLEKYAKETRAVTLAAYKATTETVLSLLLVAVLLVYNSSVGDNAAASNNFLTTFAGDTGKDIASFLGTFPQQLSDSSIPTSVLFPALAAVLWTGLVTCAYTIYAQSFGQSRVNPSDANLIYTFQPVWTSLIAYFLLGETLGASGFVGGAMIGLAVFLVISSDQGQKI